MKPNITLLIVFIQIVFLGGMMAQSRTSAIKGTVLDEQSQYPLIGVTVVLNGSDPLIGTITDVDGQFRLESVPIGRQAISFSYLGYEPKVMSSLDIITGKELDVQVYLEEKIENLDVVTVTAGNKREAINQLATVSTRTFSIEEASRFSGTFNDPARMAQNFAGVSGSSDDRNDIIVRGNSPTGVLWRIEGIDVPSPNHFSTLGTTGGPISMLNINNLSNSDFSSGAWSADYGNALSGVFDLKLRNGNSDKREYVGQIGFNGLEFGAEGPLKKGSNASYIVNYRYSTLSVFKALGLNIGTGAAVPEYQDITFKLNVPTKKYGQFTLWGLGGVSGIKFQQSEERDSTNLFDRFGSDFDFNSKTGMIGASHTYFFDNNTYYKLILASTFVQTAGTTDSINNVENTSTRLYNFDRKQSRYMAHLKFNKKFNAKSSISAGLMADVFDIDMVDSVRIDNGSFVEFKKFVGSSPLIQSYANWQYKFNTQLSLTTGLHYQYFNLSKSNAIEPRLGMKYQKDDNNIFSLGVGLHSQIQPIVIYFNGDETIDGSPNKDLGFTKALHSVLGYDKYFKKNMRLKAEVYYQHLYNVPVDTMASSFSMINEGADFTLTNRTGLVNDGTGTNYGVELTLEKFLSDGYYFLFTASVFDSKYKGSNGQSFSTVYNGNYVLNALGGYEIKLAKNKILTFNTKITQAGGRRYSPVDLIQSQIENEVVFDEENIYTQRYTPYFRLDFKVGFRLIGQKVSQEWFVDMTNLTNRQNIFSQTYDVDTNDFDTTYQRGFFPNVQYKILF